MRRPRADIRHKRPSVCELVCPSADKPRLRWQRVRVHPESSVEGSWQGQAHRRSGHDLLGIYLNDHLAGATGGLELARRMAASHRGPAADGALQRLAAEVAQDRAALEDIMAALGIPVRAYKVYAAWIGEKAARLNSNCVTPSVTPTTLIQIPPRQEI